MRSLGPWLLVLLQPLVWLWPLPLVASWALVGVPHGEVADHLWGWWVVAQEGALFATHTELIAHPEGLRVQLIDPLHRLPWTLGSALGGPTWGWAAVLLFGHQVAGAAGLLLARVTGADTAGQVLGAVAGGTAATVVGVAADGITEGLGVGWVGIQLAALLWLARAPDRGSALRRSLLLGLALAAATWSGPYNAVWAALVDVPLGLWLLRRTRWPILGGALGLLLSLPVLGESLARPEGTPGSASRGLPELPRLPETAWRGSQREGVDLLDLLVPDVLTGASASPPTTAYLGVILVACALLGLWRAPRARWGWLAGAVAFATLALGPWLMVGGELQTLGGRPLVAPAGLLEGLPGLSLISRWYRAGAVAVLLLVPLAARALGPRGSLVAALLLGLDARLGSPVPWPLPVFAWPECGACEVIDGPVANLPPVFPVGWPGQIAGLDYLHQVQHGQPTNGTLESTVNVATANPALGVLRRVAIGHVPEDDDARAQVRVARRMLADQGYAWLALHEAQLPNLDVDLFVAELGEPRASEDGVLVFSLAP